jgi:monofunctional biosynthetic peptidoglycan transglycosylase
MFRFLIYISLAAACVIGLSVASVGLLLLTTPRPTNIRDCLTTKMFEVHLCPGDSNYVRLQDTSPHLRNAVLVSEDSAFYDHHGFDFHELQESIATNWARGVMARGGSTITQQLAKNVYLSPEKSVLRKLREALIVIQLEQALSKNEIFEKYLNVVEFGPDLFGIGPASRFYFKKPPSSLTPAEGAFLAFLLPNPKKYAVSFQKKQLSKFARSQTREIVNRLLRFKRINEEDHVTALNQLDHLFGGTPSYLPTGTATAGSANSNILNEDSSADSDSDSDENENATPEESGVNNDD